jgi:serine/threonine protein kinase
VPNPLPGTILGAYRVDGSIGAGSMGEVFGGIDTGLNRRVAIKILSEKHRDSPELRARFVREGRAVAAISHPNVVQVFATGSFDERPYIAMELLDGTDLGSMVDTKGALDSVTCAHVILDAAQGLAAAAKAGLIHRDVKPSNLVRLSDGRVKVTDFGLAKPVDPGSEPALTAMGVVVGTPDYIAPEQARGETIDERVDIYALGGTLYYLLVGVPPYRTGKPAEDKYLKVVARHLRNPPPDAVHANPSVDRELADLARAMMAKKPSERPSYAELTSRLTQILTRLDPGSVPELILASRDRSRPIALPASQPAPSAEDSATISEGDAPPHALPGWLWMVTVACIALFVIGLVVYLRRDSDAAPSTSGHRDKPAPAATAASASSRSM